MKRCSSLLLAAALVLGIAAFTPVPARAIPWCDFCAADPSDCWACCKCEGNTNYYCAAFVCGSPDSALETEATVTSEDEVFACTADDPPSTDSTADEAPSTDEAP